MLRSRNGKWHYRFHLDKHEFSGSTHLPADEAHRDQAQAVAEAKRFTVCHGSAMRRKPRDVSFSYAVPVFLAWAHGEYNRINTYQRLAISAKALARSFGDLKLREIGPGQLEQYKSFRRAAGIKDVTIRHDLHALSVIFQFAQRLKWCDGNPVREIDVPSDKEAVRTKVLTPAEEAAYFAAARRHRQLHDAARLMLLTGMRPSEALALKATDFNRAARSITVQQGKTRSARRTLALVPEAFAIVEERAAASSFLFPGQRPGTHATKICGPHSRAAAAAGVDCVLYTFRHTFATRLAEAGVPLPTLAALLGHASLRCVHRYVHPSQAAMDAAIMRIAG